MRATTIFHDGLDHPEGIAVHPADGSVWCGGEAGQLYRIAPDGTSSEQVAETGGFCLGLAFDADGGLLVCDQARRALLRLAPGADRPDVAADGALRTPNACAVDAEGRIYVSDSRAAGDPGIGVFRADPGGALEPWCEEPLHFANGLALAGDGSALYVAETWARRILRIPIGPDGGAGRIEVLAELPGVLPDGVAVAVDGSVWVACYEPSQVVRIDPDGSVGVVAHDPDAHVLCHPTNLAFREKQAFVANLGRWHVTAIDAGVAGVPLPAGRAA